jgi:hypothetical protein
LSKGDFDIIILGYSKVTSVEEFAINQYSPIKTLYSTKNHNVGVKFNESTCGTLAYIVSNNFIKYMANFSDKPSHLSDDWSFYKKKKFKIFHVSPLCFYEDFSELISSIKEDDRKGPDRIRLPRKLRPAWRIVRGKVVYILMVLGIFSSS